MYIEKSIEDDNTGADVKYHEITAFTADLENRYCTVTIKSWISKRAKQLGKQAIGQPITFSYNEVPPITDGVNLINWLYNQLVKAIPSDYEPVPESEQGWGYVDPYTFAGGKLKDD